MYSMYLLPNALLPFHKKIAIRILFISSYLGWIPSISSTNWLAPKMVAYREKKTSKPETMENVYNLYITRKQQVVYNESLKFKRNRLNFDVKLLGEKSWLEIKNIIIWIFPSNRVCCKGEEDVLLLMYFVVFELDNLWKRRIKICLWYGSITALKNKVMNIIPNIFPNYSYTCKLTYHFC